MESKIEFACGSITLEGCLGEHPGKLGAVICHPHPLYGGNMHNHVVMTLARAFDQKKITTLRFNFRGTGKSAGAFDNGEGEQDDVRAALTYLTQKGYTDLWLAGYSFGARMNAAVVSRGFPVRDHIMVSPPAGFMSFDEIDRMPDTGLIVTGSNDDIAPPEIVRSHIDRWGISPQFEVIDGGDHFYSGSLDVLYDILIGYL